MKGKKSEKIGFNQQKKKQKKQNKRSTKPKMEEHVVCHKKHAKTNEKDDIHV